MVNKADSAGSRRHYDGSKRRAAARVTRDRVLAAAAACFEEQGYGATTIARIAERADVSPETVYGTFGTKRAILQAWIDRSVVGDDLELAFRDRRPSVGPMSEMSPEQVDAAIRDQVAVLRTINERVAAPLRVLRAAADADPALVEVVEENERRRRSDLEAIADDMLATSSEDVGRIVDLVAVLSSAHVYTSLVVDRGWTGQEYERAIVALLAPVLDGSAWRGSRMVPERFGNLSSDHGLHPMESQPPTRTRTTEERR